MNMKEEITRHPFYQNMIADDYDANELTFADFIEICDKLKLPVYEVEKVFNPFEEPHETKRHRTYDSMTEYRKTMPDWSAREYDYENDRPTWYYPITDIADGKFVLTAENNHAYYKWGFVVLAEVVVVHKIWQITD